MTLAELRAYLGFMSVEEIQAYIKRGYLPGPRDGRSLEDAEAVWDQSEVDAALTRAKRTKVTAPDVKPKTEPAMTPEQILAACKLLDWPREQLSNTCGIPVRTLQRIERGEGTPQRRTLAAIRAALEAAGIEFTATSASGVRLRSGASKS